MTDGRLHTRRTFFSREIVPPRGDTTKGGLLRVTHSLLAVAAIPIDLFVFSKAPVRPRKNELVDQAILRSRRKKHSNHAIQEYVSIHA